MNDRLNLINSIVKRRNATKSKRKATVKRRELFNGSMLNEIARKIDKAPTLI
jgi:hypothetical protein